MVSHDVSGLVSRVGLLGAERPVEGCRGCRVQALNEHVDPGDEDQQEEDEADHEADDDDGHHVAVDQRLQDVVQRLVVRCVT